MVRPAYERFDRHHVPVPNPFGLARAFVEQFGRALEQRIAEAIRDGDEDTERGLVTVEDELQRKLRLLRDWEREIGSALELQMRRIERTTDESWASDRAHDLQGMSETEDDTSLTVRGGRLVLRRRDGSVRESRIDLWLHICRCVARGGGGEKRALAIYRSIMGSFPKREWVDDGGRPDMRVVDLLRREKRHWKRKGRHRRRP